MSGFFFVIFVMMEEIKPLEAGKIYHIYNRGVNSNVLFFESNNYSYFIKLYNKHINPIAETYAWCLMKNHFHFLVKIKTEEENKSKNKISPSQSFSNLFNAYTKAFNKTYGRHGPLFERPFRRKEIKYRKYLQNVIAYIHNNPVNHKICADPFDYSWSSYLTCLTNKPTKLERSKVLSLFNDIEHFKQLHQESKNINILDDYWD